VLQQFDFGNGPLGVHSLSISNISVAVVKPVQLPSELSGLGWQG
jgi:hypothetical protein